MSSIWNFLVWLAELLDPINSLIGLITTIIAGFTGFMVWRESRRYRKWWQEIRRQPGQRPSILILDLLPGVNTRAQVENFRLQQDDLRKVPNDRIVVVERQSKLLPEHMPDLHKELQDKINQLKAGSDRIHVFLAAPQPATAVTGAILASSATTLYHYDREEGTYVNYGPLRFYA